MDRLRYQAAYACLSRWIEDGPDTPKPYQWRGWVLERLENPARAMEEYRKALQVDPDLFPVRLRLAELLLEDNNPVAAVPYLEGVAGEYRGRPEYQAVLGHCRLLQGRAAEARGLLESAAERLPNYPPLLVHLSQLELQEDRPAAAEAWVRRLLKADPYDPEGGYTLATCLQQQGRLREAEAALADHQRNKALVTRLNKLLKGETERTSGDANVASEIGTLLLRIGKEGLGDYWLHEGVQRDPGHGPTHRALADYYEKKGGRKMADAHRRRSPAGGSDDSRP